MNRPSGLCDVAHPRGTTSLATPILLLLFPSSWYITTCSLALRFDLNHSAMFFLRRGATSQTLWVVVCSACGPGANRRGEGIDWAVDQPGAQPRPRRVRPRYCSRAGMAVPDISRPRRRGGGVKSKALDI